MRMTFGAVIALTAGLSSCSSATEGSVTPPASADTPSTSEVSDATTLPPMKHFQIGHKTYGAVHDCFVNDEAVTCILSMEPSTGSSSTKEP